MDNIKTIEETVEPKSSASVLTEKEAKTLMEMCIDSNWINWAKVSKVICSDDDLQKPDFNENVSAHTRLVLKLLDVVEVRFLEYLEEAERTAHNSWEDYINELYCFGADLFVKSESVINKELFDSFFTSWRVYRDNRPYTREYGVIKLDEGLQAAYIRVSRGPFPRIPPPGEMFNTFNPFEKYSEESFDLI